MWLQLHDIIILFKKMQVSTYWLQQIQDGVEFDVYFTNNSVVFATGPTSFCQKSLPRVRLFGGICRKDVTDIWHNIDSAAT